MDSSTRVTRSRGGEQGRTLRNRPPTPRTSGTASVIRTPSPNRARRSASGEPTTDLPSRDEQMDGEAQPNQENQPSIVAPSVQGEVQPQTDQQQQGKPGNDSGQPASDQSRPHPIGRDLLFHPTFSKPERMIEEHMKQEKTQVIQHIQGSGIGLVW
jgi:hypothetical protein